MSNKNVKNDFNEGEEQVLASNMLYNFQCNALNRLDSCIINTKKDIRDVALVKLSIKFAKNVFMCGYELQKYYCACHEIDRNLSIIFKELRKDIKYMRQVLRVLLDSANNVIMIGLAEEILDVIERKRDNLYSYMGDEFTTKYYESSGISYIPAEEVKNRSEEYNENIEKLKMQMKNPNN